MLSFSGGLKIFLAVAPCDLRKSFNGLHGLVTEQLGEDPRSGALFVFINRRHSRLKILLFDGTGLWVCTKRLVSHCPLFGFCETALSISPLFPSGPCLSGNHW